METEKLFLKKWEEHSLKDEKYLKNKNKENYTTQFLELAKFFKIKTVLDAGCGSGYTAETLIENGFEVTAIDINVKQITERKSERKILSNVRIVKGDLEKKLPFKDNEFDAIICCGVLHHTDPKKSLPELKRVAKKMLYFGVYGNRKKSFIISEKILRFTLSKIPYKVNRYLLKKLGYSGKLVALRLEHIYIERADRYDERKLIDMIGKEYYCITERIRHWINCTAIKKEVMV